jgi:hypothetical protein
VEPAEDVQISNKAHPRNTEVVMKQRKIRLKYKKERVLLSDVLPYELPFIISNRFFYRFLVRNQIRIEKNCLLWSNNCHDKGVFALLAFLFGKKTEEFEHKSKIDFNKKCFIHIPFTYKIRHKATKMRELTVIDPVNQIQMVDFYERRHSLMLYYTSLDRFSLRHPNKVACYFYYKDKLHHVLLGRKTDKLELYFHEYENLRTYFTYIRYSNIYKFYEDYRYQRAEKKFQYMLKFDIQSCFDSIYTHSISWATGGGKKLYKEHFKGPSDCSFATEWDHLMEQMNYNETNGIVIGPEFSRIFAEIILQYVDNRTENDLREQGYLFNKDYVCYRYVDDYFFFFNSEAVKEVARISFVNNLREFKLNISSEKTRLFERPFITEITRAKIELDKLIDDSLKYHSAEFEPKENDDTESEETDNEEDDDNVELGKVNKAINDKSYLYFNSKLFNKMYKAILVSINVESKDVVNYTLARISRKLETGLKKFDVNFKMLSRALQNDDFNAQKSEIKVTKKKEERMVSNFLVEVLDSVFFLYSTNKKVNTTLKVLSILNQVIIMLNHDYLVDGDSIPRFINDTRNLVFKKIQDEISLVFQTSSFDENTQLETLYFLVILKTLRSKYDLSPNAMEKYMGIKRNERGEIVCYPKMNAISIVILLYYFGNKEKYEAMKQDLLNKTFEEYKAISEPLRKIMSELRILTLDILSCPFVNRNDKRKIATLMGINDEDLKSILKYFKRYKFMFTRWTGVDVTKELNAKISQEVYS